MTYTTEQKFRNADGSINMGRAIAAGHKARGNAFRSMVVASVGLLGSAAGRSRQK